MAKEEEEVLDEESQRRDQVVKGAIEGLIREYASELNAPSQDGENHPRNKKRKEKKEEVGPPLISLDQVGLDQVWLIQGDLVTPWTGSQQMTAEYDPFVVPLGTRACCQMYLCD